MLHPYQLLDLDAYLTPPAGSPPDTLRRFVAARNRLERLRRHRDFSPAAFEAEWRLRQGKLAGLPASATFGQGRTAVTARLPDLEALVPCSAAGKPAAKLPPAGERPPVPQQLEEAAAQLKSLLESAEKMVLQLRAAVALDTSSAP
eukprot:m.262556 g.262556  ORF g.262556 m.262556 type:complete len:146 (+) comp11048_c0_seq6:2722-3159(+)